MRKNSIMIAQILGTVIFGLIYIFFILMYTDFVPYTYAFTCLALFLSLFSALIFKSKTRLFKVINILFFLFTLYQLFSYKSDMDYFRHMNHSECTDENRVLNDLTENGIINELSYEYKYEKYNEEEGKCILTSLQTTDKILESGDKTDGK